MGLPHNTKQKIFLLADDDSDDTELFCEALTQSDGGAVCHCAGDGQEALQKLNALDETPSLIFLDINMPVMDGWQCLKQLKADERYKHIPVIMYSTSSHQREVDTAMELGALCFFTKPISFEELMEILGVITKNVDGNLLEAIKHFTAISPKRTFACSDE